MRKLIHGKGSAVFWFTTIIYVTLASVTYVGAYLTDVAVPTLIVTGCLAWSTRDADYCLRSPQGFTMSKQLSRGTCFGVVVASIFVFTLIAEMLSPRAATNFLGAYIAYLLFQLIFFYIFRAAYKNKERGWATLFAFIGFAVIPAFLGVATRYAPAPATVVAPSTAFVIFIAGWWIFFAVRKAAAITSANEQ